LAASSKECAISKGILRHSVATISTNTHPSKGGRLAVIDFEPAPGSKLPNGVPANRGGHGIRANILIEEVTMAGFTHDRTISRWPQPDGDYFLVLFGKP
jgi:hypothetical protein